MVDLTGGWSPGLVGHSVVAFGSIGGACRGTVEPMEGGEGKRGSRTESYTQVSWKSLVKTGFHAVHIPSVLHENEWDSPSCDYYLHHHQPPQIPQEMTSEWGTDCL